MKYTKNFSMIALAVAATFASCSKDSSSSTNTNPTVTNSADTVAVNSLVAYFKFNADVTDKKGHVAVNNGVTFTTDRFGTAADAYHGSADAFVDVTPDALMKNLSSMTYSVWLRTQNLTSGTNFIFTYIDPNIDWNAGIGLWQEGSNTDRPDTVQLKGFTMHQSSSVYTWLDSRNGDVSKVLFPTAKWFQVIYTYDATSSIYKLFLNGVKVMQDTSMFNDAPIGPITIPSTATDFFIGKNPNTAQSWLGNYVGDMDDFRLYNVALTEAQVGALYTGENGAEGN